MPNRLRRLPLPLATILLVAGLLTAGPAAGSGVASTLSPRAQVQAFHDRLHAAMVARGLHPQPAIPATRNTAKGPNAFRKATHVKRISQDTLEAQPGSEPDTQIEPDIAVDPNNPNDVVAVFQQGRFPGGGSVDPGWAASLDGGKSWATGNLPKLTKAVGGPFDRASDPAVAFGPDGSVYACTLVFNSGDNRNGVAVQRSDDGGITWKKPVFAQDDMTGGDDKNWITVDTYPSSPHVGRIYIAWDLFKGQGQPIVMRWSDDRGVTWSALKKVSPPTDLAVGARPVVQPNGDLTIVYEAFSGGATIVSQTSHDGGANFDGPVTVATDMASDPPDQRAGSDLPSVAVDPTNGIIDVVWGDTRFRSDGLMDAVISRSKDGGQTWGSVARVSQDPVDDHLDHLTPAVDANSGFVHVTYLTRSKAGGVFSMSLNLRYIASADNGKTFGGELVVGPTIKLKWSAVAGGHFLGDYMGVAATPDAVHPVWCRSSRPPMPETYHQTTWSATISR